MAHELPDDLFRWIVETMPEAVVYSDREGIIRLWNRGAEAIFGHREQDVLGQTLDVIIPERWRARHWAGYRAVMQTGVTRYGSEVLAVPATRRDGTLISIEFSIILPTDSDGQVLGAVAIVRDVTTRWEQERALRKRLATLEATEGRVGADPRSGGAAPGGSGRAT
jgi:PAS domain S-box-containing protein